MIGSRDCSCVHFVGHKAALLLAGFTFIPTAMDSSIHQGFSLECLLGKDQFSVVDNAFSITDILIIQ